MSKAALTGLARGLARDLGPRGITAVVVHPGSTNTDMNPANDPAAPSILDRTALKRFAAPEEIADFVRKHDIQLVGISAMTRMT